MKLRKLFGVGCLCTMLFSLNVNAMCTNYSMDEKVAQGKMRKLKEERGQINFSELNVAVVNDDELIYSPKLHNGKKSKAGIKERKELDNLLDSCPKMKNYIIEQVNRNENVAAIGYTTVHLIQNAEGEMIPEVEEVELVTTDDLLPSKLNIAEALYTKRGDESVRGTCTLYTTVYRGSYNSSLKKYNFSTHSKVDWSEPNWIGGANYHGSGWDYLLQSLPSKFTITGDSLDTSWWQTTGAADRWWFSSNYDDGYVWASRSDGGSNYIRWDIKDEAKWDVLGACTALAIGDLTVTSKGPGSSSNRYIRSYYVHTWDEINLDVEVSVSSAQETVLGLSTSSSSKSWQLYSYVSFNDATFE